MAPSAEALRLEALLAAAPGPVAVDRLDALLGCPAAAPLAELAAFWSGRGMRVRVEKGSAWLEPAREVAEALAAAAGRTARRLSEAAVETLAVVALHQPVTLPDIERLRGVKLSRGLMDSLLDAGLVRASMRRSGAGRAAVYVTTEALLERYALEALTDLPTPDEVPVLLGAA